MELTEEDVLEILNLLEKSDFDFLQLQTGDLKLVVSKGGYTAPEALATSNEFAPAADPPAAAQSTPEAKPTAPVVREGTLPITAPMVGTFYITPEPGAPPFVEVGSRVDEDTTVGLIEVMKVFNAVKSGVGGIIDEICAQGGQFVEYRQTLFLVKPLAKG